MCDYQNEYAKCIDDRLLNKAIEDVKVERVYECRFLGVVIDSRLTWKSHILRVKDKLSECNAFMFKTSALLDSQALRTLYCSLFLPYINCCSEVWGKTFKSSTD